MLSQQRNLIGYGFSGKTCLEQSPQYMVKSFYIYTKKRGKIWLTKTK